MAHLSSRKFIFFIGWVLALVLLCYSLPTLLFWPLCLKEDLFRPPNTEVLISACNKGLRVTGVPGGEVLFVSKVHAGNAYLFDNVYLLDLRTGEKKHLSDDDLLILDRGIFLNSELVWLQGTWGRPDNPGYRPNYILDLTDGQRYELLDLGLLPRLDGGKFNPEYYAYFQPTQQVFIHHSENTLIALSSDFRTNPNGRVIFSQSYLASFSDGYENGELLEQLMKNLGVKYEIVDLSLQYANIPSPTGRYVARNDGIYLSGTNTPVVNLYSRYYFRGWYYDESGMVFRELGYDLIHIGAWSSFYHIPSPVLKLRLPEAYLVPTPSP